MSSIVASPSPHPPTQAMSSLEAGSIIQKAAPLKFKPTTSIGNNNHEGDHHIVGKQ